MRPLILFALTFATCNISRAEEDFVLGDAYSLEVTTNDAKIEYSGPIVGLQDDWIAIEFTGTDVETRYFRAEPIKREVKHTFWIPREAISAVQEHTPHEGEWTKEPVAFPAVDDDVVLNVIAADQQQDQVVGKLKSIDGETITVLRQQTSIEVRGVPLLSDLPFAGAFFRSAEVTVHEAEHTVDRSDVRFMSIGKPRVVMLTTAADGEKKK